MMRATAFAAAVVASADPAESLLPKTFSRLPLGTVEPQGWLLDQLVRQANSLAGYMSKSTFPGADVVNKSIWVGGDGSKQGGTSQWLPYWTNGQVPLISLIRAAGATDRLDKDLALADTIDSYMLYVLQHRNTTNGWIGPYMNEPGDGNGHGLWDPLNMIRSLLMWAEDHPAQEASVVTAVVAHLTHEADLLKTDPVIKWASTRWPTFLEICQHVEDSFISKYGANPDVMPLGAERTRGMLRDASKLFKQRGMDWAGYYHQTSAHKFPEKDVQGWNTIDHGVNNAEGAINWPATAYRMTGDPADARELDVVLDMIDKYQGTVNAMLCADEVFCGRAPHRGTETCAVVEAMASLEHSFTVFGNVSLMDRTERLAFNAMPAALTGDMWANVYVQQANSVFAGRTSPTPWPENERGSSRCGRDIPEDLVSDQEESACLRSGDTPSGEDQTANFFGVSHFPCCITNFPQGWPKFAMHAIVAEEEAEPPAAVIASPVPAAATMPLTIGGGARIVTETQYPFSDSIKFRVSATQVMQLKVRIPGWADRATLNGQPVANGTFAVVQCPVGETVANLQLNPEIRIERGWGQLGIPSGRVSYNASGSVIPTAGQRDFSFEGGASVVGSKEGGHSDLRSGLPGQTSTVTIMHPLAGNGHYITSLSMQYRYVAGYSCLPNKCNNPPHFELIAVDATSGEELATVYRSPDLDQYSYDQYSAYSPLQMVNVQHLKIPNSKLVLIKLRMINGKHNVQLQMDPADGFNFKVQWSEEIGTELPEPSAPWLEPPTDGLGVMRGPLLFALHPQEQRKVAKTFDNPPRRPQAVDNEISTNETWNYGILPAKGFKFVSIPSAGWKPTFAFDDTGEYPFYITAKAKEVKSWGYWHGSMITDVPPPSPVTCLTSDDCGDEVELRLVPFGSTNIRISVFPWVDSSAEEILLF